MKLISKLIKLTAANEKPAPVRTLANSFGNYCISLHSQPERLKETRRQLKFYGLDLEHFPAVPSKEVTERITRKERVMPIANGCLQSHIDLYKQILASHKPDAAEGRPYVAVFEDDIVALSTLNQLDDHFARLPGDWDFVYLGGNYHFHKPVILDEHLIRPVFALSTHAQLIRIDFLPLLIQELEKKAFEVDVVFARLQEAGIGRWYGFTSDFFWQHGRTSASYTSLWRHQIGEFHFATANGVIDQVIIRNYLP